VDLEWDWNSFISGGFGLGFQANGVGFVYVGWTRTWDVDLARLNRDNQQHSFRVRDKVRVRNRAGLPSSWEFVLRFGLEFSSFWSVITTNSFFRATLQLCVNTKHAGTSQLHVSPLSSADVFNTNQAFRNSHPSYNFCVDIWCRIYPGLAFPLFQFPVSRTPSGNCFTVLIPKLTFIRI